MADVAKTLKDAAYVAVGFGVIGFQKGQVRRNELTKQFEGQRKGLESQLADYRAQLAKLAGAQGGVEPLLKDIQSRIEPAIKELEGRIDPVLDQIEGRLPEQARELVHQARTAARDAREQLVKALQHTAA